MNISAPPQGEVSISIVMPVYNAGDYLTEALASIEANAMQGVSLEVILVNDCSTDPHTIDLLAALAPQSHVTVIHQTQNGGPAKARNAGMKAAKGDWVGFLDADDLMLPGALAKRMELIRLAPDAEWIAGDFLVMHQLGEMVAQNYHRRIVKHSKEIFPGFHTLHSPANLVTDGYPIFFGCMLIRKSLIAKAGLINDKLFYTEDWHYSVTLAHLSSLYWIAAPLLCLRRHHESLTKDLVRASRENYKAELTAYKDPRFKDVKDLIRWRLVGVLRVGAKTLIEHNKPMEGLKLALMATYHTPTDKRCLELVLKALLRLVNKEDHALK